MKRSRVVPLTLVATIASAGLAAACGPRQEPLHCVQPGTSRVVADSLCRTGNGATRAGGGGFYPSPFLWYYGGRVAGGLVSGGGYQPLAGRSYRSPGGIRYAPPGAGRVGGFSAGRSRSGAVSRGGFGGVGAGRGAFGG